MQKYSTKIDSLIEELLRNSEIDTPYSFRFDGLSNEEIMYYQEKHDIKLNNVLKDYYSQCNFTQIQWCLRDGNKQIFELEGISDSDVSGVLFIPDLTYMLEQYGNAGKTDFLWLRDRKVEDEDYLPFDIGVQEEIVCLKVKEGYIDDNLYLVSIYEPEIIDMNIGVEKYIDLVLQSKAFSFWQRALIFKDSEVNERLNECIRKVFVNTSYPLTDF